MKDLLRKDEYAGRFKEVLHDRAPQFMSSLLSVASTLPPTVEPRSVIAAAMQAACLDLPIERSLGFAHIVPYKDKAQFQIGYKGLVQLALRTGQYRKMNAVVVNSEAFIGYDEVGDPMIDWSKLDDTKEVVGYAFAFSTVAGFNKCVYWKRAKVTNHAARYSQAYRAGKKDSPWFTHFDAMALKTVVKDGITHWGIMTVELRLAVEADQSAQADLETPPVYVDAPQEYVDAQGQSPENDATPGDFKPQPEQVVAPKTLEAAPPIERDPLAQLVELMTADGVTFEQLRSYAGAMGHVEEADSIAEVAMLPRPIIKLYVRVWKNVAQQIRKNQTA